MIRITVYPETTGQVTGKLVTRYRSTVSDGGRQVFHSTSYETEEDARATAERFKRFYES